MVGAQESSGGPFGQRRRVRVGPAGSAGELGWALRAAQGSSGGPSGQRRGVRGGPSGSAGEFGWALRAAADSSVFGVGAAVVGEWGQGLHGMRDC